MSTSTPRKILTTATAAVALALAANASAVDFAPAKTLATDLNPTAMATGDLNNDGVPDLVTANFTGGNVSVLLGTTDNLGNFGTATNIDVGVSATATDRKPWSVAIGNVVGDSNLDIVVAVSGDDEVTILQGDGTGTAFSTVFHEATGNDPRSVALGDVDLDADLDIVVGNMNVDNTATDSVTILLNDNGADTFTEVAGSPFAAGSQPFGVVVADATGNNIPDVVVANFDTAAVSILAGAGDGTFGAPSSTAVGAGPYAVAVADLDGANGPDLVVTNSSTGINSISVLLDDGIGGFVTTNTTVGSRPRGVVVADISGTADLDVIVTESASDTVSVLEGDGSGAFPAVTTSFAAGTNPRPLVVADFDGDSFLDIAVSEPNAAAGNATVLINDNPPVAGDDAYDVINGSGTVALDVLANDSDPDSGDTLTITAVSVGSQGGTIAINGTNDGIDYAPAVSDNTETFTYTVEDQFGYGVTATVTVTIGANQAPSFTSSAVMAATQDAAYTYNITTTDPDTGDTRSITAPTKPGWLTLTDNGDGTATLTGTPTNAEVGANNVSLLVTDAGTLTGTQDFTITVANVNDAPSFTSTAVTTATEDVAYSYSITATDPDVGDTLAITATTIPTWLTLTDNTDGTATLAGTPTNADVGPHSVDLLVTDSGTGALTDTQSFTVTVGNVNDPPTAVGTIAAQSATELTAFGPLDVSGNFVDPDSPLAYSISGLPTGTGLTIGSASGEISGTPTDADAQASPISVIVSATDGSTPATQPFTLTVADINQAPSITSTAVTAATQDVAYSYSITSSDADSTDTHAITATTLPSWLTLTDNGDGTATLSGTPANANVGANPVVLVITDSGAGALTDTQSFTVTVANVNDAPVVTSGGIILFEDATSGTVQVNASDVDTGDTLSYAVTQQPATVGGSASVDTNGLVTYTVSGATAGSDTIQVTVTDDGTPPRSTIVTIPLTVNASGETDSNSDGVTDAQATALGLDPLDADGDTDGDGVLDANEIGDPAAPADSDNDSVIDALEASTKAADASIASGIRLSSGDIAEIISVGQTLSNVAAVAATGGPAGVEFPFGTLSYTTTAPIGGSVTVRMIFSADLPATPVLYKVDGANTYTELASGLFTKVDARTIDVTLTDGDAATDLDGVADGSIDDPIAVGSVITPSSGGGGGGGGCTLVSGADGKQDPLMPLMMLAAVVSLYRRKRNAGKA